MAAPNTPKFKVPPRRNPPSAGKQAIDKKKWDQLLDAFRKHDDNFTAVAAACGVHWNTAKKAWLTGWAHLPGKPWAVPIKQVVHREKIAARAALAREKEALVSDHRIARQDSLRKAIDEGFADLVDSRAKQGKVIRAARDNSIASLVISQKMLKAAIPLSESIAAGLANANLSIFEQMRLLRQIGQFSADAVQIAQHVDEMERKALGEPSQILQVQGGVTMSLAEAKDTLAEVAEVLQMYEEGDVEDVIEAEWRDRETLAIPEGK